MLACATAARKQLCVTLCKEWRSQRQSEDNQQQDGEKLTQYSYGSTGAKLIAMESATKSNGTPEGVPFCME